jgi:uncharacterized SAM-binding protein YcdF (DUF218 family)
VLQLKSAAEALLLPPISLLLLALIGLLIERHYRRLGRWLAWVGVVGVLVLAMPAVGGSLLVALESNLPLTPPSGAPPQAIVILGGELRRSGTTIVVLHPGPLSFERLRAGAMLYRETHLPILITGGVQRTGEPSIAAVMAESMEHDFQVPVQWIEGSSRDTWQNAQLSAAILHQQNISSVYVVTQAWHMRRALIAFAHTGITVTAAPTRFDRLPTPVAMDFVPDIGGWRDSFYAIHEWIGCAWYELL